MNIEIERKWLLKRLPDIQPNRRSEGYQSYLSVDPAIRVRMKIQASKDGDPLEGFGDTTEYYLTVKGKGSISRAEFEFPISEKDYNGIIHEVLFGMKPIHKENYYYDLNGYCDPSILADTDEQLRIDVVDRGTATEFIYAEVEFKSVEDSRTFEFPFTDCGAVEVTGDPALQMASVWRFYHPLDPHVWLAEISKGLYSAEFDREFREREATRRTTSPTSMSSYIDGKPYTVGDLIVSIMCHCPLDMPVSMPNTSENCIGYADLAYTEFGPPKYREKHYSVDLKTGTIPLKKDVPHYEAVVNAYTKIEEYNKEQLK